MTPLEEARLPTAMQARLDRDKVIAGPMGYYALPRDRLSIGPCRASKAVAEADLDNAASTLDRCPRYQRFDAARAAMAGVAFALLASPAMACGDGGCTPPPPPPPEPPKVDRPERADPVPQVSLPLPCCIRPDGSVEYKAPLPGMKAATILICETAIREQATIRPCTRKGIW